MRRPRYKLQVSTFPFLAVLLCAMGSLLLFLFIMDRRAKIAAQHANDEALQARKKRTKDEEESLQADWEKAKEKLHQALLLQEGQLAAQGQGLQIDLDSTGKKLHLIQTQYHELDEQAKAESAKIAEIQVQIISQRKSMLDAEKEADQKDKMSKKELLDAAQELAESRDRLPTIAHRQGAREASAFAGPVSRQTRRLAPADLHRMHARRRYLPSRRQDSARLRFHRRFGPHGA